jgi:hypothetical protein
MFFGLIDVFWVCIAEIFFGRVDSGNVFRRVARTGAGTRDGGRGGKIITKENRKEETGETKAWRGHYGCPWRELGSHSE